MKRTLFLVISVLTLFAAKAQITVTKWNNYTACPVHITITCFDAITCNPVAPITFVTLPPAISPTIPGSAAIPAVTCPGGQAPVASINFSCQPSGPHYINLGLPFGTCIPSINHLQPPPISYCFPATCSPQCDWTPNNPMCITYDVMGNINIGL